MSVVIQHDGQVVAGTVVKGELVPCPLPAYRGKEARRAEALARSLEHQNQMEGVPAVDPTGKRRKYAEEHKTMWDNLPPTGSEQ